MSNNSMDERRSALAWHLDAHLREIPVDPRAFEAEVDRIVDEIATARSQPARLLAMLVEAAPLLLIAGRIEEARKTASAAIALAELLEDVRAVFVSQLHLAKTMQWEMRFDISTPLFDRLIAQSRARPDFRDLLHATLYEAGVNMFAQQRFVEAARFFRESQALRREARLDRELEDTAEALRRTAEGNQARERSA